MQESEALGGGDLVSSHEPAVQERALWLGIRSGGGVGGVQGAGKSGAELLYSFGSEVAKPMLVRFLKF